MEHNRNFVGEANSAKIFTDNREELLQVFESKLKELIQTKKKFKKIVDNFSTQQTQLEKYIEDIKINQMDLFD
jgi:hypothetical protein